MTLRQAISSGSTSLTASSWQVLLLSWGFVDRVTWGWIIVCACQSCWRRCIRKTSEWSISGKSSRNSPTRIAAGFFASWPDAGDFRPSCMSLESQFLKLSVYSCLLNPLKGRGVNWLHLAIQVEPTFLISDIRALWRSGLSARVPECQKLKM